MLHTDADAAVPLGVDEFSSLIDRACRIPSGAPVAVAVSGGGDSMALALLAHEWARASSRMVRTVTVDHGLRSDSADEAKRVQAWLAARGIAHDTLLWEGDKPRTGLQDAARDARYRLIGEWAGTHGIRHLLVAHQLEDQAETMLMRLARGSGITGLAGMNSAIVRDGLRICRPLLSIPRARLRATLEGAGQAWVEDPSNDSPRFTRTAYRRLVAGLEGRGIDAGRLAGIAGAFAQLDNLMAVAGRRFLGEASVRLADGSVTLARVPYAGLPVPVAQTVLRTLLGEIGGRALAPRGERLERARGRLVGPEARIAFTLGYCRISANTDVIRIAPEPGRLKSRETPMKPGVSAEL